MVSKIGKMPVDLPAGVTVEIAGQVVTVKGPKGELKVTLPPTVTASEKERQVTVKSKDDLSAFEGLARTLIYNSVQGVTSGWSKSLELVGTGYRAALEGTSLNLSLGFSHPIKFAAPDGITFVIDQNKITVSGNDKSLVGQTAAKIRKLRPPEPYKGKGVKYLDEKIRRKAGKAAKAVGGTAK